MAGVLVALQLTDEARAASAWFNSNGTRSSRIGDWASPSS